MIRPHIPLTFVLSIAAILLIGCNAPTAVSTSSPTTAATSPADTAPAPTPAPSATSAPSRTLVVCLSEEPQTLYIYGGASRSMWNVLEAIYDGPFDTRSYSSQPVILQKMPSIKDGDAVLKPVAVQAGDPVVDVNGELVSLQKGTPVFPSGCSSSNCGVPWDGSTPLKMDQLSVTFKLRPGIQWSDGSPLTAEDSVFSYTLAADPATPTAKGLLDRTVSYTAVNAQTVQWVGVPGFIEQNYPTYFFLPLPKHVLKAESAAQVLKDEQATHKPIGWGPYVIDEWVAGDHIRLHKNPAYFRAGEGLPKFDVLVYRFAGSPADSALSALTAGECDVVDQNPGFIPQIKTLADLRDRSKLKLYLAEGPEWEHLDFGIRPASYDDGYDPSKGDRPDLFGDVRTRRAIAACINRKEIIGQLFNATGDVPNGFLAPSNPLFQKNLAAYPFDPQAGKKLLDEVGWKQPGGDPAAVRVAAGVQGVPDGTPFTVNYTTTDAELRQNVARLIAQNLTDCGIGVKTTLLPPDQLFAPGPQGPLFGRTYDLAEFYWASGPRSACLLYTSQQIPSEANHWIGANVTGYNNPAFDAACNAAAWARPDQADYAAKNQAAEKLFVEELPVIPLYYQLKIAISRPDLCGLTLDLTARSLLPNLEELDYGKCGD